MNVTHYPIGESYRDSSHYYDENRNNYRIDFFNNNAIHRYEKPARIIYEDLKDSLGNIEKGVKQYQPYEMTEVRDYKTINEKLYLNQVKFLNKQDETIMGRRLFFTEIRHRYYFNK